MAFEAPPIVLENESPLGSSSTRLVPLFECESQNRTSTLLLLLEAEAEPKRGPELELELRNGAARNTYTYARTRELVLISQTLDPEETKYVA